MRVSGVSVTIQKHHDAPCGQALGKLTATASGGTAPYSYLWSNGSTEDTLEFIGPGTYTVTVTDALGDVASDSEYVISLTQHAYGSGSDGSGVHCAGDDPYVHLYLEDGYCGPAPHTILTTGITNIGYYQGIQGLNYHYLWMAGVAPSTLMPIAWMDSTGCVGYSGVQFSAQAQFPALQIGPVQGACNGDNGSIGFSTVGGNGIALRIRDVNGQTPDVEDADGIICGDLNSGSFSGLAPGAYWLILDPDLWDAVPDLGSGSPLACVDSFYVVVPDLSGACGRVNGTVFLDEDQDCSEDADDVGVPFKVMEIMPGPHYGITGGNGQFSYNLPNGSYTLSVQDANLYSICPTVQPIPFSVNGGTTVVDIADSLIIPLDVVATGCDGPARPGFVQDLWLRVENQGGSNSAAVQATLTFDPQVSFISADPVPSSVVGNVIQWSGYALGPYAYMEVHVQLQVPPDPTLIGTQITHTLTAEQAFTEANELNNTILLSSLFTGSYDPNDKVVRTSTGESENQYFIGQDEWLDYTIRFQNTGTDTAFTVIVTDTLDADLDMGTFEQGVASHPFTVNFKPGRIVRWRFVNIQLPDSNTNEPASHGLVSFRIRPVQPLLPGTLISNNADIFFDFNPPVRTNDAVVVAETSTQVAVGSGSGQGLRVFPNPVNDELHFAVPGGSGPYRVDVIGAEGRLYLTTRTDVPMIDLSALPAGFYALRVNGAVVRFVKR
jgi:uncharacterized repeat protein (TIGR01451 family)